MVSRGNGGMSMGLSGVIDENDDIGGGDLVRMEPFCGCDNPNADLDFRTEFRVRLMPPGMGEGLLARELVIDGGSFREL